MSSYFVENIQDPTQYANSFFDQEHTWAICPLRGGYSKALPLATCFSTLLRPSSLLFLSLFGERKGWNVQVESVYQQITTGWTCQEGSHFVLAWVKFWFATPSFSTKSFIPDFEEKTLITFWGFGDSQPFSMLPSHSRYGSKGLKWLPMRSIVFFLWICGLGNLRGKSEFDQVYLYRHPDLSDGAL